MTKDIMPSSYTVKRERSSSHSLMAAPERDRNAGLFYLTVGEGHPLPLRPLASFANHADDLQSRGLPLTVRKALTGRDVAGRGVSEYLPIRGAINALICPHAATSASATCVTVDRSTYLAWVPENGPL